MYSNVATIYNKHIKTSKVLSLKLKRENKMNKSIVFKLAHRMAKMVHVAGECYRVTFGAALKSIRGLSEEILFCLDAKKFIFSKTQDGRVFVKARDLNDFSKFFRRSNTGFDFLITLDGKYAIKKNPVAKTDNEVAIYDIKNGMAVLAHHHKMVLQAA